MTPISPQRVTVKDVARLAGVSTATVTRAFQDDDQVVAETRQRVMNAVEVLGYRPNPMARDLRQGGRRAAVGLAISSFANAFQTGVAAGAERELRKVGLQLLIGSSDVDISREPEVARGMVDRRVSVLMMMPDSNERDFLQPQRLYDTPVVLVGRPASGLDADVVTTDDERGVDEATGSLLSLGHTRIAALAGSSALFRARQRLDGFRTALARHGVAEVPELIVPNLLTSEAARVAVERLLALPEPPTAILALNLGISDGVLLDRVLHSRRTAYIALDESELSIGLGISAIVRDPEELGRQAALLAISRIDEPERATRTVVLPSHLVRRGSGEISRDSVPS